MSITPINVNVSLCLPLDILLVKTNLIYFFKHQLSDNSLIHITNFRVPSSTVSGINSSMSHEQCNIPLHDQLNYRRQNYKHQVQ